MRGWLLGLGLGWLTALVQPAAGQNPHFSQYYAAPLYLNPALAALEKSGSVGLNYRDQWRSLGFSQKTGQLSLVLPVYGRSPERAAMGSLGATVYSDVLGENNTFRATGAALSVSRALYNGPAHVVAAGVQAGLAQKRLDVSGLQWGSQYNPSVGFNPGLAPAVAPFADQRVFPVVHAGLLWHYNHFRAEEEPDWSLFTGLAAGNLNRPDESLLTEGKSRLSVLYKFHGGLHWQVSNRVGVSPNWLVMRQNGAHQVNTGAYLDYTVTAAHRGKQTPLRLSAGAWYRLGDAFIWSVGTACKNYTLGFSYDLNVSSLRYGTGGRGAYEFSLTYRFAKGGAKIRRYATPLM
jgi:type IX secretion system PorP/SprF family membrane protein